MNDWQMIEEDEPIGQEVPAQPEAPVSLAELVQLDILTNNMNVSVDKLQAAVVLPSKVDSMKQLMVKVNKTSVLNMLDVLIWLTFDLTNVNTPLQECFDALTTDDVTMCKQWAKISAILCFDIDEADNSCITCIKLDKLRRFLLPCFTRWPSELAHPSPQRSNGRTTTTQSNVHSVAAHLEKKIAEQELSGRLSHSSAMKMIDNAEESNKNCPLWLIPHPECVQHLYAIKTANSWITDHGELAVLPIHPKSRGGSNHGKHWDNLKDFASYSDKLATLFYGLHVVGLVLTPSLHVDFLSNKLFELRGDVFANFAVSAWHNMLNRFLIRIFAQLSLTAECLDTLIARVCHESSTFDILLNEASRTAEQCKRFMHNQHQQKGARNRSDQGWGQDNTRGGRQMGDAREEAREKKKPRFIKSPHFFQNR